MTWVLVWLHSPADEGLQAPTFSPDEVYPLHWEIVIDAIYLDSRQLADSTIPATDGVDSTLYTIPIELVGTATAVNIDTSSSDLWVISDQCTQDACQNATLPKYSSSTLTSTSAIFGISDGDSSTGTGASGPIGRDIATVAGVAMAYQAFGVVNAINGSVFQFGVADIPGLGFPSASAVQRSVVQEKPVAMI
ncbi:aspartic peptidase domain-containing protein [Infundibulicybe gibba]|nr:aspartic peptidase domain-containing protein [Infundibulicybe gibba]